MPLVFTGVFPRYVVHSKGRSRFGVFVHLCRYVSRLRNENEVCVVVRFSRRWRREAARRVYVFRVEPFLVLVSCQVTRPGFVPPGLVRAIVVAAADQVDHFVRVEVGRGYVYEFLAANEAAMGACPIRVRVEVFPYDHLGPDGVIQRANVFRVLVACVLGDAQAREDSRSVSRCSSGAGFNRKDRVPIVEARDLQGVLISKALVGMFSGQVFLIQIGINKTNGRSPRVHLTIPPFNGGRLQDFPTFNLRGDCVNYFRQRRRFTVPNAAWRDSKGLIRREVGVCRVLRVSQGPNAIRPFFKDGANGAFTVGASTMVASRVKIFANFRAVYQRVSLAIVLVCPGRFTCVPLSFDGLVVKLYNGAIMRVGVVPVIALARPCRLLTIFWIVARVANVVRVYVTNFFCRQTRFSHFNEGFGCSMRLVSTLIVFGDRNATIKVPFKAVCFVLPIRRFNEEGGTSSTFRFVSTKRFGEGFISQLHVLLFIGLKLGLIDQEEFRVVGVTLFRQASLTKDRLLAIQ